jgi:predicted acetyltransferase
VTSEDVDSLVLRALEPGDEAAARRAQAEFDGEDFMFLPQFDPTQPFNDYLALLERQRNGQDLPSTHVPATFLVADMGGMIVGRSYLRHHLNDRLLHDGGHVGYGVRPAHRGHGIGTQVLLRSLDVLVTLGIDDALVTVADDNAASCRVAERCGGRLGDIVTIEGGTRMCRYWIPTRR